MMQMVPCFVERLRVAVMEVINEVHSITGKPDRATPESHPW